jgi:single stranded DNA-binding protein
MGNMNFVILSGRIGKDPVRKETAKGTSYAAFTLATNEYNSDSKQESTEWHNIVVYGSQADRVSNLLSKGDQITLRGKLSSYNYKINALNTKTGAIEETSIRRVEIVAFDIDFEVKSLKKKVNSNSDTQQINPFENRTATVKGPINHTESNNEHWEVDAPF